MSDAVLPRLTAALADRYRIERELGAGGMATVFLAHDLKHERDVAIKVLHPDLGAALGGERFLSEIKTTAKLQHPHILPLLDSGEADGLLFYVMPYVTGETLRARLQRETQLPVADALRIAGEVGDALAEAHAKGVIHRDIKPENILLQGNHALVADFGIALAVQQAGGARMTQTGLSLGTPQYMAPEQAMGDKNVDHRADVYALGAVTYEMLTGEPPHTGANAQAIVAKLLTEQVRPASTVRPSVPPHVDAALATALEKLPADRFAQVSDLLSALRTGTGAHAAVRSGASAAVQGRAAERRRAMFVAAITLVALSVAGGWLLGRRGGGEAPARTQTATVYSLEMRRGERVAFDLGNLFAMSRDGTVLAYLGSEGGKPNQLYLRRFDELEAKPIPGSVGATNPAFSPDGRWIAFIAGGQIAKVPVDGGQPVKLAQMQIASARGLSWLDDGRIVFAAVGEHEMFVVPENGGAITKMFALPAETGLRWPVAVPGTKYVLYTSYLVSRDSTEIFVGDIKSGKSKRISGSLYSVLGMVDGRLIYLTRTGEIMAAAFDLARAEFTETPVRVGSGVLMNIGSGLGFASLSATGDLVYRGSDEASQLVFVNQQGLAQPVFADTAAWREPKFSPDGRRIVIIRDRNGSLSVLVYDRTTRILSQVSPEEIGVVRDRPEWMPDGQRVMYRLRNTSMAQFVFATPGAGFKEDLVPPPTVGQLNELHALPDGKTFITRLSSTPLGPQALAWWREGDTNYTPFVAGPDFNSGPRFSPNGKWVAWSAQVGGARDVYLAPFPAASPRVQVSSDGGGPPIWSHDGSTLYYFQGRRLMAASLTFDGAPRVKSTKELFTGPFASDDVLHSTFDVDASGTFVMVRPVRDARTIVIRNFGAEVRRQMTRQGAK